MGEEDGLDVGVGDGVGDGNVGVGDGGVGVGVGDGVGGSAVGVGGRVGNGVGVGQSGEKNVPGILTSNILASLLPGRCAEYAISGNGDTILLERCLLVRSNASAIPAARIIRAKR